MNASAESPELRCNAGVDIIFTTEPHRCGQPARRVCVIEFAGDPGLIETYCPAHIAALKRDGYKIIDA